MIGTDVDVEAVASIFSKDKIKSSYKQMFEGVFSY